MTILRRSLAALALLIFSQPLLAYYCPTTGRFLSRDPAPENWQTDEINQYAFVRNSPAQHVDVLGHCILIEPMVDPVVEPLIEPTIRPNLRIVPRGPVPPARNIIRFPVPPRVVPSPRPPIPISVPGPFPKPPPLEPLKNPPPSGPTIPIPLPQDSGNPNPSPPLTVSWQPKPGQSGYDPGNKDGECCPCPKAEGDAGPHVRIHKVPPSKPHYPCKSDHLHRWWFVVTQRPYPNCRCYYNRIEYVQCLDTGLWYKSDGTPARAPKP